MTSPICTVNGSTTGNGVDVAKNSTVTIAIADTAGVKAWSLRCITTDDNHSAATITSALSINLVSKTATFTSPNVSDGAAMIFESKVNGGLDINGRVDESLTTRFGVYVVTDTGNLRVGAFDETVEGNASFGWLVKFNAGIRSAAASALTPALSGTLPIVVNSANPIAPIISINAATTSLPGSMSAADKTKLNASTALNTASTIVERGSDGSINATKITANVWDSAVSPMQITMDGPGVPLPFFEFSDEPKITANYDIEAPGLVSNEHKIQSSQIVSRALPLHWQAGVDSFNLPTWVAASSGEVRCAIAVPEAELYSDCDFAHGMKIRSLTLRHLGAGSGVDPLPVEPPRFGLYRKNVSTGGVSTIAIESAVLDAGFRGTWRDITLDLTASPHTVDTTDSRYYIMITSEHDTDAIQGEIIRGVTGSFEYPANFKIGLG